MTAPPCSDRTDAACCAFSATCSSHSPSSLMVAQYVCTSRRSVMRLCCVVDDCSTLLRSDRRGLLCFQRSLLQPLALVFDGSPVRLHVEAECYAAVLCGG